MRLGAGVDYLPPGARPKPSRLVPSRPSRFAQGMRGLGDDGSGMYGQAMVEDLNRRFNESGFTPSSIIPVLQATNELTARNLAAAQDNASKWLPAGNAPQMLSDAKNDDARAKRMLAQMQSQADAGDQTIYSNPSPTWGAVKDAVLGPYYWASNQTAALVTQTDVDRQMPAIVAKAVVEAPKTFASAVGTGLEYVRDELVAPIAKGIGLGLIPRWVYWAAGAGALMFIARPYVAPLLKRVS